MKENYALDKAFEDWITKIHVHTQKKNSVNRMKIDDLLDFIEINKEKKM